MQLIPDVSTAYLDPFREARRSSWSSTSTTRATARSTQGPAPGRQEGREVPRLDRHRRHRVLRPRGRVLHLRRRALRSEAERASTGRLRGGAWNTGRAEEGGNLGNKTPYKGGYFPVSPSTRRPTSATTSRSPHRDAASSSSARTTRSAPAASRRSTTASTRWCTRPTTS
jgi:hypothetical protein